MFIEPLLFYNWKFTYFVFEQSRWTPLAILVQVLIDSESQVGWKLHFYPRAVEQQTKNTEAECKNWKGNYIYSKLFWKDLHNYQDTIKN